jgi:chromosome segregation ATPase
LNGLLADGTMEFKELQQLKEKIQSLIRFNNSLLREKKAVKDKLLLREKQVRELRERCERYEESRKEAFRRINTLLDKLDGIKS